MEGLRTETVVPAPRQPLADGEVLVTGDVHRDWVIATVDLHAHAGDPIDVPYTTRRRNETHHVQGVYLHNLLARVPLKAGGDKMERLTFVVTAQSADGYRVALSWAEVDPEFGACSALLATRYNGRVLTLPTLVVPHDHRSSRYVRDVRRIQVSKTPL